MKRKLQNILLIDDDEINNFIINEFLKELKIKAKSHSVNDGEEAITYLKQCEKDQFPDLIFVDIRMPNFDGFEFLEAYEAKFYQEYPHTILFMITSFFRESDSHKAKKFACLTDLISKEAIYSTLKGVFEQHF